MKKVGQNAGNNVKLEKKFEFKKWQQDATK